MPTLTIEYANDAERLALEQAIAFVTQLRQLAATAPAGTVLAVCEQAVLQQGRALLRDSLAAAVQQRIAAAEPKGGPHPAAAARNPSATRANGSAPSAPPSDPCACDDAISPAPPAVKAASSPMPSSASTVP
jgi:hypothetical protein